MKKGKFIVFEGLDGAGTSTQVYRLREYLILRGVNVEISKEPTNGPIGTVIRLAIEGRVNLDSRALALAFAADRADHLFNAYNGILTSLDAGRWIISDRYVLSSFAYQGIEVDDRRWLEEINNFVITPDLTFFVDTPVSVCADRINSRSSHIELFHTTEKLENVATNFTSIKNLDRFTGRLVVVDGTEGVESVYKSLLPSIDALLAEETQSAQVNA
ncbi:MAG: dTMP kinase [Pyrinomonadaceae bacterium]|nr:dTMP kinase [Pyrinomonadaceae bacterium]